MEFKEFSEFISPEEADYDINMSLNKEETTKRSFNPNKGQLIELIEY